MGEWRAEADLAEAVCAREYDWLKVRAWSRQWAERAHGLSATLALGFLPLLEIATMRKTDRRRWQRRGRGNTSVLRRELDQLGAWSKSVGAIEWRQGGGSTISLASLRWSSMSEISRRCVRGLRLLQPP
jgi:hypothetical protein